MTPMTSARFQAAIADRYVVDDVLGQGGAGVVYLARDVKHGRQVAIKVLDPDSVSPEGARGFLKEIRLTARLQHPHILPLLDSGEAAGFPYYVMPYVKGGSLRDLLERKGRLSLREAMEIAQGIAEGLRHAHDNRVVHCDIKPENILLSDGHAVLADFGVSRALRNERNAWRAAIDTSVGTPAYVSPEQASGDHVIGAQTDLYSLACVFYEMLAGTPPFNGANDMAVVAKRFTRPAPDLRRVVQHLPARVALALRRAMAVDPRRRYRSVAQFKRALDRAASRRNPLREYLNLGAYRLFLSLRSLVRRLGPRRTKAAAQRLLEKSKESLETARLGATTGAGLGTSAQS